MRIAVLLSGGVDSSVALRLLHAEGHELVAYYLKIWLEDELAYLGQCPWEEDLGYARAVCDAVDVPLEVVPLQREYHGRVVSWAVSELAAGRTPSPDVLCNRRVKFGAFFEHLERTGAVFDKVASGHYARVLREEGRFRLFSGVDPVKDQTYFLFRLDQEQLSRCLFPVGGYAKRQVRRLARSFGLPTQDRKDSQGICFLGKLPYNDFVKSYLGENPGEIREARTGRLLGEHRGLWFHTVGQRKGLGLGGGPWYVVGKDMEANVLLAAHQDEMEGYRRGRFRVGDVHWIGNSPGDRRLGVRIRHTPVVSGCRLASVPGGLEVVLDDEDPGVAAGQCAVFYDGDECLGGGTISEEPLLRDVEVIEHPVDEDSGDRDVEPDRQGDPRQPAVP